jgi:hypothetical protein
MAAIHLNLTVSPFIPAFRCLRSFLSFPAHTPAAFHVIDTAFLLFAFGAVIWVEEGDRWRKGATAGSSSSSSSSSADLGGRRSRAALLAKLAAASVLVSPGAAISAYFALREHRLTYAPAAAASSGDNLEKKKTK